MATGTKLYFASDFHLGSGGYAISRERENRLVRWLDMIKADAAEVFLMGASTAMPRYSDNAAVPEPIGMVA